MSDLSAAPHDKFRAYRTRKRAAGLRELRLWGPDLRDPSILARLRDEGSILRGAPEEAEAADFIDAVITDTVRDTDD